MGDRLARVGRLQKYARVLVWTRAANLAGRAKVKRKSAASQAISSLDFVMVASLIPDFENLRFSYAARPVGTELPTVLLPS